MISIKICEFICLKICIRVIVNVRVWGGGRTWWLGWGGWGWHENGSHKVIWYDMIRSYNLEFDVHRNYYTNWINKIIWKYHIYWEIYKTKYIVDFHLKIIYIIYLILLVFKQHFNRFIFLQRDWACKYFNYIAETYLISHFVRMGWGRGL